MSRTTQALAGVLVLAIAGRAHAQTEPSSDEPAVLEPCFEPGPRARWRRTEHGAMLWGVAMRGQGGDRRADSLAALAHLAAELGVPDSADVRVDRVQRTPHFTIVRARRFANGLPVINADAAVRWRQDGRIDLISAALGPAAIEGPPRIAAERAIEAVRAVAGADAQRASSELAAYALPDRIVPIWRVWIEGSALDRAAVAMVDARDGRVLAIEPLARHGRGRVFLRNPVSDGGVTDDVDLFPVVPGASWLVSDLFNVGSCDSDGNGACLLEPLAAASPVGDFTYAPNARSFVDPFAEVNAYHHLHIAADYQERTNGFVWECQDGTRTMVAFANYVSIPGEPYDNAFFMPGRLRQCGFVAFGQTMIGDYAYDADIVYHEHGHAVTNQALASLFYAIDDLGVSYEPMAIDEGTSDFYAAAIQGDPIIAESFVEIADYAGGPLRRIDEVLVCPADLSGEGHDDGRLWAGLGWSMREHVGADPGDAMVFTAVASLTSRPSLANAADALLATAMSLEAMGTLSASDVSFLEGEIARRQLEDCRRIVDLPAPFAFRWTGNQDVTPMQGHSVAPVHYRIQVPADASQVRVTLDAHGGTARFTLHARNHQPVEVATNLRSDAALRPSSNAVTIDDASYPPGLPRCGTLYLAVETDTLATIGDAYFSIAATVRTAGGGLSCGPDGSVIGPDAGRPDAAEIAQRRDGAMRVDAGGGTKVEDAPGGGCGCALGSRRLDRLAAALGALVMLVLVRRRARGCGLARV